MADKTDSRLSLQETYAPNDTCFGCGQANLEGLQLKSFVEGSTLVARWWPQPKYESFAGVLNGGIIGTLFDCHCNWTAAWNLMGALELSSPPCTVTAEYAISLKHPTRTGGPIDLQSEVVTLGERSATIEARMMVEGQVTATARAVFVMVKPGHPAFHRW